MSKEKYFIVGELGRGGFGVVYLITNDSGNKLSLKTIDLRKLPEHYRADAQDEAKIISKLKHPHLVHYINSYVRQPYLCIITEFCAAGDLGKFVERLGFIQGLPEKLLTCWLLQSCSGLNYMHTSNPVILHRDLKPQNIYVTESGDLRLGDFGLARKLANPGDMVNTAVGTIFYLSPEMLKHKPYNSKTDIWSLGCIFYDLSGKKNDDEMGVMFLLMQVMIGRNLPLPDTYSAGFRHLITSMLTQDPRERPSAQKILNNPILQEFQKNPQKPADIIAQHSQNLRRPMPVLIKDLNELRLERQPPLSPDEILVPVDAVKILEEAVQNVSVAPSTVGKVTPSPPQMLAQKMSANSLFLFGSTATGNTKSLTSETDSDSSASGAGDSSDMFFDDQNSPEYGEEQFILKIEELQRECTRGLGAEILEAAYGVLSHVKDQETLKKNLEELMGKSLYGNYGAKIMQLRLLEFGLHKRQTQEGRK